MALVGVEGPPRKPVMVAGKAPSLPPPLPWKPTPADMASLDVQYSNVVFGEVFEDQQVRYDPRTGEVRIFDIDDEMTPPALPRPRLTKQVIDRVIGPVAGAQTISDNVPPGYRSPDVEDRRGDPFMGPPSRRAPVARAPAPLPTPTPGERRSRVLGR